MWEAGAESRPREALERQTLEGLRRTLGHVLAHAAWRRRLDGVEPGDIRTTADWSRLPFLTKDELRDAYPFGLACVEPDRVLRVHMSSGTTGNPVLNPYTRADVEQWAAVMARCYVAAGVGARDVVQITPSFGLFTGGFGFHYGAERIGAMVVPIGAGRTSLQLQLMRDLGATVLTGISTYPLRILEVAREERFDLARSGSGWHPGLREWSDDLAGSSSARSPSPRSTSSDDRDGRAGARHRLRGAGTGSTSGKITTSARWWIRRRGARARTARKASWW